MIFFHEIAKIGRVLDFFPSEAKSIYLGFSLKCDSSKKSNYIDVVIFEIFSLHRKKPELCIFVIRKCLKTISSVKKKFSKRFFGVCIPALVILCSLHNNLIHKVWVDLINER